MLGRRAEGLPESIAFSREVESDTNTGVKGLDKDLGDEKRGGNGEYKLISRLQVIEHESLEFVSFKGGSVGSGSVTDPDLTTVS